MKARLFVVLVLCTTLAFISTWAVSAQRTQANADPDTQPGGLAVP
jgi:hypothetical protein